MAGCRRRGTARVCNPATGELVAEIAYGDHSEATRAMDAAAAAFPVWKQESAHARGAVLDASARLIRAARAAQDRRPPPQPNVLLIMRDHDRR